MKKTSFPRRISALILAVLTLWISIVTADSRSLRTAAQALGDHSTLPLQLLRWELGCFSGGDLLTAANLFALSQSPLLLHHRRDVVAMMGQNLSQPTDAPEENAAGNSGSVTPDTGTSVYTVASDDLHFADNGAPSQTVVPASGKGYTLVNGVYIKNTSSRKLDTDQLSKKDYSARLGQDGPQVLIIHSHGSEAYTMPAGEEYTASGSFRTKDTDCNVVRIGDEIAAVLSAYGISVLHDRTLHDAASYDDAYDSSLTSTQRYREKYPSLTYVLDVHRDAIQSADGKQYKLVTRDNAHIAQCCLVLGLSPDTWQDNMKLAIAVQETLDAQFPTLMRPIAARGYRYNQHLCPGSLLVEVGAAGNSLDEAIMGARCFAKGFAETILAGSA